MTDEQLELANQASDDDKAKRAADLDRERERLELAASSSGKLDTGQERVAWLLNHYPDTRDSDRALWFRYWSIFESDHWDGESLSLSESYALTHPATITRARAKIQNDYSMFRASHEVRARRGTLAEEEREKAVAQVAPAPLYSVFADESGKTAAHLIVGSVWFPHAPEIIRTRQILERFKDDTTLKELHFRDIDDRNLDVYLSAAELIAGHGATISFKAVSVERRGIGRVDAAFEDLFYHLLVRGVQHEAATGRAPLPRRIDLMKDLEEIGRDKIVLANIRDRVAQAGASVFDGELSPARFVAEDSAKHPLLQVADLYTGSINRLVNTPGDGPKDAFARRFLQMLGTPEGPVAEERAGDLTVHITL